MRLLAGTSGFAYKEWKGTFYPKDLPQDGMLAAYAARLPAVEINNTFYRMPSEKVVAQWASRVPETFAFVLKASQQITHRKRLKGVEDPLGFLVRTVGGLGGRLGVLLFQLPPNMKADVERLRDFLALLPDGLRTAFEFRHPTWFDDAVYEALAERSATLCLADTEEGEPPMVSTAPTGYLRLRRETYDDAALAAWLERVRAQAWEEAFVFFKHEDAGAGPALALRFLELAGPSGL